MHRDGSTLASGCLHPPLDVLTQDWFDSGLQDFVYTSEMIRDPR